MSSTPMQKALLQSLSLSPALTMEVSSSPLCGYPGSSAGSRVTLIPLKKQRLLTLGWLCDDHPIQHGGLTEPPTLQLRHTDVIRVKILNIRGHHRGNGTREKMGQSRLYADGLARKDTLENCRSTITVEPKNEMNTQISGVQLASHYRRSHRDGACASEHLAQAVLRP